MSEVISLLDDDESFKSLCDRHLRSVPAKDQYPLAWNLERLQQLKRDHASLLDFVLGELEDVATDPNLFALFWVVEGERVEVSMAYWVLFVKHRNANLFGNGRSLVAPINIEMSVEQVSRHESMAPVALIEAADPQFSFGRVRAFIDRRIKPERGGDGGAICRDVRRYASETFAFEEEKLRKDLLRYEVPFWLLDQGVLEKEEGCSKEYLFLREGASLFPIDLGAHLKPRPRGVKRPLE